MSLNLDFSRNCGLSNTPVEYTNWRSFKNMYKGTGLSNTPVEYTNSRSFTNVYKGKGSISSSKLLQGLGTGQGMNKGHTILNTGGGLKGTSLFRLKHYNPLGGSNDEKKDRKDEKDEHKHDETDKDKKVESDEGDESSEGDENAKLLQLQFEEDIKQLQLQLEEEEDPEAAKQIEETIKLLQLHNDFLMKIM